MRVPDTLRSLKRRIFRRSDGEKVLLATYESIFGAKLGNAYLPRLLWHGEDPRRIPFDALPNRYMIKTNHGTGGQWAVHGMPDRARIIEHFDTALKQNYYWHAREYQYFKIRPRILVEEFLDDGQPSGPLDYRFWCFNSVPELIQVDNSSHGINPFYDRDWRKLDLSYRTHFEDADIAASHNRDLLYSGFG